MNILVVCAAGMSSSALVTKMRIRIAERDLENMKVGSCASFEVETYAIQADVILLAPQLSFMEEKCRTFQSAVFVLDKDDYAFLDADHVINVILGKESPKKGPARKTAKTAWMHSFAAKLRTNPFVICISEGMNSVLPVTVCGSLFSLAANLPLPGYQDMLERIGLMPVLSLGYDMTFGMIAVYLICTVSISAARRKKAKLAGPLLASLISFFMFAVRSKDGQMDLEMLGPSGIFSAMISGVVISFLFLYLKEHLPRPIDVKGMPENVQQSFLSLLPLFVCVLVSMAAVVLVRLCGFNSPSELSEHILQSVFSHFLGSSIFSYLFMILVASVLWFFGVHGGNVVGALTDPVYLSLSLENIRSFQAGNTPPHIINSGLSCVYYFGGIGSTLGLAFLCAYFAKSRRLRTVGKISFPMGIFFINEPLLFGLPIILNPHLFLPFVLIPTISGIMTMVLMKTGILPFAVGFPIPWTTPPIISGFIQGGQRLALWQVVLLIGQTFMWYPFFRALDQEEKNSEERHS